MDDSGWRVHVAARLRELPAGLADAVLAGLRPPSAYTSRRELTALETPRNNANHLVVCGRDGVPVAYAPVFVVDPAHTNGYDPRGLFGLTGPERFALVGGVGGYHNHLMFAPELTAAARAAAADLLVRRATALADAAGVATVVLPYLDPTQAAAALPGLADRPRHHEPRGVLDVTWTSFEGYRDALSRKPRATVRNERRAFDDVRKELVEEPLAPLCDQLAPLLGQVERRYGLDFPVEHVSWYLRTIARGMGEYGRALVLYRDGAPVAFSVVWQHPEQWHVRAWGCDYDLTGAHAEYANVVFYEPIERAIECGVPAVHFGPGSLPAKVLRGARAEDLVTVLVR